METMFKALLLGNTEDAKYHPLENIRRHVCGIFEGSMEISCTEDYEALTELSGYDLLISYADRWDDKITRGQTAGILSFVSSGKGLLILHNGISLQNRYEFAQLAGAKFIKHPPFRELKFVSAGEHPIIDGIDGFMMEEEPYMMDMDNFTEKKVFLRYIYENEPYPAGWSHEYGMGRVVYLMPGHNAGSFMNPVYREIILRSGKWLCKIL